MAEVESGFDRHALSPAGAVQKLLDRYKADSYDAIARHLPAEMQMYVPRVEATLQQCEGANLEQHSAPQG